MRIKAMKKALPITLALALLGGSTTAAVAHGRPGHGPPVHRGYYAQPYGGYGYGPGYGYRRDNSAAALGLGLLAFGLVATLAAQNNARNYYGPPAGYYGPPPAPAPYGYGYRYGPPRY
jgi:hypothetical protein